MAKHPHLESATYCLRKEAWTQKILLSEETGKLLARAALSALPDQSWYAVCCKPGQEARAFDELTGQGFRVYRPKVLRHPDDEDFAEYGPIDCRVPGYLFVQVNKQDGVLTAIENTKGVECLVYGAHGGEKRALSLPDGTVEKLRRFEEEDLAHAIAKKPDPRADLREGIEVLIDDKTHPVNASVGVLMFLDAKVGKVLVGGMLWPVEPAYLKKVVKPKNSKKKIGDQQQKRAA